MTKKLTKKELDAFRDLLLSKRGLLSGSLDNLQSDIGESVVGRGATTGDSADMGADTFEQDFMLSLMENEGDIIEKIDEALERIEDGSFGVCGECGKRLPKARLKAIPWTSTCVDCQRKAEAS